MLLMEPKDVFPLLHIKLGLMKNFIKEINQEEKVFKCFRDKFFILSTAKVKKSNFWGPQI